MAKKLPPRLYIDLQFDAGPAPRGKPGWWTLKFQKRSIDILRKQVTDVDDLYLLTRDRAFLSQRDALRAGRELARQIPQDFNLNTELVVHQKDENKIRDRSTYPRSSDPKRSKG